MAFKHGFVGFPDTYRPVYASSTCAGAETSGARQYSILIPIAPSLLASESVAQEEVSVSKDQSTAMHVVKSRKRSIRSFDRSQNGLLDFSSESWNRDLMSSLVSVKMVTGS